MNLSNIYLVNIGINIYFIGKLVEVIDYIYNYLLNFKICVFVVKFLLKN